jgi:hypothetical protein
MPPVRLMANSTKLVYEIIGIVVLAAIVNGLGPTLIDSMNDTAWGPISVSLLTLIANLAMGLVLLFATVNLIKGSMGGKKL